MIGTKFLYNAEKLLRSDARKGRFDVTKLLSLLCEQGFKSVRFYDAVHDELTDKNFLYLSSYCSEENFDSFLGSCINFKDTPLCKKGLSEEVVIRTPEDRVSSETLSIYNKNLKLCDDILIQVPVFSSDNFIGELSCSWNGCEEDVSSDVIEAFKLLSAVIGRTWRFATNAAIEMGVQSIESKLAVVKNYDIDDFIGEFCKELRKLLQCRTASIFEYNCYENNLKKIYECSESEIELEPMDESYLVDEFLTGRAFRQEKSRNVANFDSLYQNKKTVISEASKKRLEDGLGKVQTVIYRNVGDDHSRYMYRAFNRSDMHDLPFTLFHKKVLKEVVGKSSRLIEFKTNQQRLEDMQTFSVGVLSDITDIKTTVEEIGRRVSRDFGKDFLFLAAEKNGRNCKHFYTYGQCQSLNLEHYQISVSNNFRKRFLKSREINLMDLSPNTSQFDNAELFENLIKLGYNCSVIVPCHSEKLVGFLLIPKTVDPKYKTTVVKRIPESQKKNLSAYAANLIHVASSSDSYLTAENALLLIGHIGHEIETPVSIIGQGALKVVNEALHIFETNQELVRVLGEDHSNIMTRWNESHNKIASKLGSLPVQMDVAVDMAMFTDSKIEMTYESFRLDLMLKDCADIVASEIEHLQGYRGHTCVFNFNDAACSPINAVGDIQLIEKIFTHIFRNALKYSIPSALPEPGEDPVPIEITVNYNPQISMHRFEVINWGTPIRAEVRQKIKNPFQRGDVYDRKIARKGMGLGLFIADQFAKAHSGEVFCKTSIPTLDDPSRREIEGWLTTFVIQFSKNLLRGVTTFERKAK